MKVIFKNIPKELKPLRQWVLWKYVGEKRRKVPFALSGGKASASDPKGWSTLQEIIDADPQGYEGVGFVFTEDDPYVGIDLDNCMADPITKRLLPWAQYIWDQFGTYAEVSPSGNGVKIFAEGSIPGGRGVKKPYGGKEGAVEVYAQGRFFTVTGQQL